MGVIGVIPARMGATRFPGKPLADLAGRPLIQWVYEAAAGCADLDAVVVGTPDPDIFEVVKGFGGVVEFTKAEHPTGTDRVAEVAGRHRADTVVNVQADQPFVTPAMISALVQPYRAGLRPSMTTVAAPIDDLGLADPNTVKVVCDQNGDALYFSRSPIPFRRQAPSQPVPVYHHIGLYAFARPFLEQYAAMTPTPLEQSEGLEQLRALEHGQKIRVCRIRRPVLEINTPEDLEAAVLLIQQGGAA